MNRYNWFLAVAAALGLLAPHRVIARQPRIEILEVFDAPGAAGFTSAQGINARGDITGWSTTTGGFVRFRNGQFGPDVVVPSNLTNGGLTLALDVNSTPGVCGYY